MTRLTSPWWLCFYACCFAAGFGIAGLHDAATVAAVIAFGLFAIALADEPTKGRQ